ncbi:MAG: sigma-70 family RNA polymerase sigma factor [Chloroflexota bacterium]|nr:sigma-70 family RNA polymerase sigma factor [Chloroflexota bacterium]
MTRTATRQGTDVLASAAAGDEIAFRRIIADHHEDMRRVCRAIAGDDTVADEAVEAAWVVAWKKLGMVRGPAQLRPWLVSVAANEVRHLLRKRRRRAEVELPVDAAPEPGSDDSPMSAAALDLHAALARLDHDDAALLAMRYVAGFDSTELGLATGKSSAAIRQRLRRLLDRLHEELGDD